MQLYPAIDMKNGKCVRLRQGAFKDITVYSEHPEEIAALWQEKVAPFSCQRSRLSGRKKEPLFYIW